MKRSRGAVYVGLIIVIIGIVFLLSNLNVIPLVSLRVFWPLIFVIVGLFGFFSGRAFMLNLMFIVLGVYILVLKNNWLAFDAGKVFWPGIIVIIGLTVVFGVFGGGREKITDKDSVNLFAFFGGNEQKLNTKEFKSASASAVFGGVTLDLRDADIAQDYAIIDAFAMFGGTEIIVPENWIVEVSGVPIFGAFENSTSKSAAPDSKKLKIQGFAMFGGVDIRNNKK